jgi:hypothetical protein
MNINLKVTLYNAMEKWMNDNCESDDWPKMFVGNKTSDLMAEAAASVFDAVEEFQVFAMKEGYLEDAHL